MKLNRTLGIIFAAFLALTAAAAGVSAAGSDHSAYGFQTGKEGRTEDSSSYAGMNYTGGEQGDTSAYGYLTGKEGRTEDSSSYAGMNYAGGEQGDTSAYSFSTGRAGKPWNNAG